MSPASDGEKEVERARLRSDLARRRVALERSLPDLLDEVRRLYPIDEPACALGLPRRTRDPGA